MIINAEYIRTFSPCESGIVNFETRYPNFNGSLKELLLLEYIPYSDKIWLATKVVDIKILQAWSVECAETVLKNYEKMFPTDSRIKDCLKVTKSFLNGLASEKELSAAESAAKSAAKSAAWSAASAAESAARSAAWSAAESAARSAAWSAARSAAKSAAEKEQEDLNLVLLISLL